MPHFLYCTTLLPERRYSGKNKNARLKKSDGHNAQPSLRRLLLCIKLTKLKMIFALRSTMSDSVKSVAFASKVNKLLDFCALFFLLPVVFKTGSLEEFKCFVKERVVDSAEAAEELGCSKQNVDDLAKREKLHPIKEGAKYRLFLKSEVTQRKWK